jgi:hypothetical protein
MCQSWNDMTQATLENSYQARLLKESRIGAGYANITDKLGLLVDVLLAADRWLMPDLQADVQWVENCEHGILRYLPVGSKSG